MVPKVTTLRYHPFLIVLNRIRAGPVFYDHMSRYCGIIEDIYDWSFPKDGLYNANDVSPYWEESDRYAFIIRVDNELGGFVLVNKIGTHADIDWNMEEFSSKISEERCRPKGCTPDF